jgi:hypothetical protein
VLDEFPGVMVLARPWMYGLDTGGQVQRSVERAVLVPRQAVADHLAARDLDRCGAE